MSKMEAFADNNFSVAQIVQFFFDRVQNIVEKEKMLKPAFPPFPTMFSKGLLSQGN